ncbi:conserved hypothetical protein [Leptothrix cholodnii SP-6]|uniref:Uncharacterized protein n=1 Tax=Leptothrix cholodnii (strain ATCC 51168 / LMG 8142 / SP-6) TaxID=395495 RepID=B1XZ04_LEPCP|nr:class I SAM-dependent methyltransferase [Leptothrix cholodnii]ACB34023.1 conserved hypothetical protein [Leptothrix cholodnii SP-6]
MSFASINEIHRRKTGKVSDKWASYLPYYDQLFAPLREQPIQLLEIGVQNGGSLETWAEYFGAATTLIGCDIDPKCAGLRYTDPRVQIVVGDANQRPAFQAITAITTALDVVIDDGSHVSRDVINSFINYFPLLQPGGIYVVEDAHCLYMDAYGGGVLNEYGAYAFFKRLVDIVSFEFWENDLGIAPFLRTFFEARAVPAFIGQGWIESVEFRNSIITIRKAQSPTHKKLGERLTVGDQTLVQDWGGNRPGAA